MRTRRSYTLVELVIIMVLIGILAGVGYAVIDSFRYHHLRSAADRLANDLKFAKSLALNSSRWHGLSFDPVQERYTVYETDGAADTPLKKTDDPTADFVVDLTVEFNGVGIASANIGGGQKIEFNPRGQPFTDKLGGVVSSTAEVVLTSGNETLSVKIAPETGRVFVE